MREHIQSLVGSQYRVDRELRGAGMSRIFTATDLGTNGTVIVKVLPPELAAAVSVERFRREIKVLGQLRHPKIVPVLSAEQSGDLLYYIMPFVGQSTLRALIDRDRALPLADVVTYASDVAEALEYAHENNVVHRDVKPDNILIDRGRALLTDFGIARAIERAGLDTVTSTGIAIGTPLYMSPEQAAGERDIDGRSDVYSLACVVFEMLTGDPPFRASIARSVIAMHLHERPPSVLVARPDLPAAVASAVSAALAKSPADRPATPAAFAASLQAAAGSSTFAHAPARSPAARVKAIRYRILAAVVLLLAAATAIYSRVLRQAVPAPTAIPAALDPTVIAVLPFVPAPNDSTLAAVAMGFTRDLIATLQAVPRLRVISPEGVDDLAGARPDVVARRLHVGTIVSGNIERVGDSLQTDFRLIDAATSVERSSAQFRSPATAFVTMRDSIVHQVATQLRAKLGQQVMVGEWRSQTQSNTAWELRQRAQRIIDYEARLPRDAQHPEGSLRLIADADSLLADAARADPRWTEPLVARGQLRLRLADFQAGERALAEIDAGLVFANQALARRPDDAPALALRGNLRYQHAFLGGAGGSSGVGVDSARADLLRAVAIDPHLADAWVALSGLYRMSGNIPAAVDAARSAIAADAWLQSIPGALSKLVYTYLYAGQADSARALCVRGTAQYPKDPTLATCELGVLGYSGRGPPDIRRVWRLVAENERSGPWVLIGGISPIARLFAADVLARSRMTDSARAVIEATHRALDAARAADDYLPQEAYAWLMMGDTTRALSMLHRALDRHRTTIDALRTASPFSALADDPRLRTPPR